jgi:hypothetical protein
LPAFLAIDFGTGGGQFVDDGLGKRSSGDSIVDRAVPIEDIPSIVTCDLYRGGAPLGRFHRSWLLGGGARVTIAARPEERCVLCTLTSMNGPDVRRASCRVSVSWTRVGRSSRRAWLHCFNCRRRARCLFLVGRSLVCRQCAGIRYESKNRSPLERSRIRADRLRAQLGIGRNDNPFLAPKPKGMHWSTFSRLQTELLEEECRFQELLRPFMARELAWLTKMQVRVFAERALVEARPPLIQLEDVLRTKRARAADRIAGATGETVVEASADLPAHRQRLLDALWDLALKMPTEIPPKTTHENFDPASNELMFTDPDDQFSPNELMAQFLRDYLKRKRNETEAKPEPGES